MPLQPPVQLLNSAGGLQVTVMHTRHMHMQLAAAMIPGTASTLALLHVNLKSAAAGQAYSATTPYSMACQHSSMLLHRLTAPWPNLAPQPTAAQHMTAHMHAQACLIVKATHTWSESYASTPA
jgi:hypothetical protein